MENSPDLQASQEEAQGREAQMWYELRREDCEQPYHRWKGQFWPLAEHLRHLLVDLTAGDKCNGLRS